MTPPWIRDFALSLAAIASVISFTPATNAGENLGIDVGETPATSIQRGDRVSEEQARRLSETAGIVFYCSNDEIAASQCRTADYVSEFPATSVSGLDGTQSAKVFVCGYGGNTVFQIPDSRSLLELNLRAETAYNTLNGRGECGSVDHHQAILNSASE